MMRQSTGEYTANWHFGITQAQAKSRAGGRCETCGKYRHKRMSCHHIDMNRSNDDPDNIVYLCDRCHLDCHRWSWVPGEMIPLAWHGNIPRWIVERGLPYKVNKQLRLFEEMS